jgi:hypothetical protein
VSFLRTSIIIESLPPGGDEGDEADDEIDEIRARLIDEEPALVICGVTPATTVLLRYMVRTMGSSN